VQGGALAQREVDELLLAIGHVVEQSERVGWLVILARRRSRWLTGSAIEEEVALVRQLLATRDVKGA